MSTQTMIAWYYVFVGVVLLGGQQYFLKNAHKEAVIKLTAQYEQKLKEAGMPAAAAVVAQAAPAAPAPAAAAAPAPAEPAAKTAAAEKDSDGSVLKTIFASSPKAKPMPTVPVRVGFRSEPFEDGKIVLVTNTSAKAQAYKLSVVRPTTGERESFQVTVPAAAETRITGQGEWAFKKGDQLQIAAAGFAPRSIAVP